MTTAVGTSGELNPVGTSAMPALANRKSPRVGS